MMLWDVISNNLECEDIKLINKIYAFSRKLDVTLANNSTFSIFNAYLDQKIVFGPLEIDGRNEFSDFRNQATTNKLYNANININNKTDMIQIHNLKKSDSREPKIFSNDSINSVRESTARVTTKRVQFLEHFYSVNIQISANSKDKNNGQRPLNPPGTSRLSNIINISHNVDESGNTEYESSYSNASKEIYERYCGETSVFPISATTDDYGYDTEYENENTMNETTHTHTYRSRVMVSNTIDEAPNDDNVNNNVHMVGLPIAPTFRERKKKKTFSLLIRTDIHIDGHDEHRLPNKIFTSVSSEPVAVHERGHDIIVPSSDRASTINKTNANVGST